MLSYAFVDAFTRVERQVLLARLHGAIADAEGVIVDFAFFSDGAIRITVELAAGAVRRLRDALEAGDVHLFDRCAANLDRNAAPPSSKKPVLAMLHVAFSDDELLPLAG
jgi:hypothetical protein